MRTVPVFALRRASELCLIALVALAMGCDLLPVDEIDRCGVNNPPDDCSCADNEAEMEMDLGVRSASCPECLQSPRHPDCADANQTRQNTAGEGADAGGRAGSAGSRATSAGKGEGGGGSNAVPSAGRQQRQRGQCGSRRIGHRGSGRRGPVRGLR